jgi:hypothetical protein
MGSTLTVDIKEYFYNIGLTGIFTIGLLSGEEPT